MFVLSCLNVVCEVLCDVVWFVFVAKLCLCVFALHVLALCVCDVLCDAVCGVCVSLCVALLFELSMRVVCGFLRCCTMCELFAWFVVCLCLCLGVLCVCVFCLELIV